MVVSPHRSSALTALTREASLFYRAMFGREPSPEMATRYALVCQTMTLGSDVDIDTIVTRGLDVEAIEFYLRSSHSSLTKKFALVSYLGELDPSTSQLFVSESSTRIIGWVVLAMHVPRSIYLRLKGFYLVRRYRLV